MRLENFEKLQGSRAVGMDVLVVGAAPSLMWPLPALLARAGFSVDVIATSGLLRVSRFVQSFEQEDSVDAVVRLAYERICGRTEPYDWVIACDDEALLGLSSLDWPEGFEQRYPQYLARARAGAVSHIYSKIGLARVLSAAGIRSPAFRVVRSCAEAVVAAGELGYPVLVKRDSASGGTGVYPCAGDDDVLGLPWLFEPELLFGPVLVQKRIEGRELDLSAIYFERKLVHFAYSSVVRTRNAFGVSSVRVYSPLPLVSEDVFEELAALGRALDADGFASISCIDAHDGSGRYYFEADMRPNAWCDVSRMFGEDAAPRIRRWFRTGKGLRREEMGPVERLGPVTVPYFTRIALWELAVNRFGVWGFIPWADWPVVVCLLCSRVTMPLARMVVPGKLRRVVKRGMVAVGVPIP